MNRRQRPSRAQRDPGPQEPRPWSEAPALADLVLAPFEAGLPTCAHLESPDGTTDGLPGGTEAAYLPQVDRRLLCGDCSEVALHAWLKRIEAGNALPCGACGQPGRALVQFQTPPEAQLVVAAWVCRGCATAAGAAL